MTDEVPKRYFVYGWKDSHGSGCDEHVFTEFGDVEEMLLEVKKLKARRFYYQIVYGSEFDDSSMSIF